MAKRSEEEGEKGKISKKGFAQLRRLLDYVFKYKGSFFTGLIFLFFSSLAVMVFPYVSGELIDLAQGKGTPFFDSINQAILFFAIILIFQAVFSFFRVYLFARVSERSMADLRKDLFQQMITLPIPFFDQRRTGELLSRISSDVSMLQNTFSTTLAELIRQVLTLIVGIGVIFYMAPRLSIFMLITFPVIVLVALFFGRFIRKLSKATQDELADSNTIVEETLGAIRVVKAFTNELFEIKRYQASQSKVVQQALKAATYRGFFISFVFIALFGGIVAILWYGATLVRDQVMSVGDLVSFVIYTTFIGGSVAGLGDIFGQLQRSIGASERILEILDESTESVARSEELKIKGKIAFRKVSFTYPTRPDMEVLRSVDIEIQPGEKIALVGPSGAGKSTLIQLLLRHYQDFIGQIQIDDQDIQSYALSAYRRNLGLVPQEITLFGGSIKENILYGNIEATDDEVWEAARLANAMDFIKSFPEGLETLVGEKGIKLSGGQRQRIAIARAILRDPSILILDEATSNLDAASENLVQEALEKLMEGRTTIIIAHRLATIRKVDRILVVHNGEIAESGTHEELLEQNEIYSNLVKMQLELS